MRLEGYEKAPVPSDIFIQTNSPRRLPFFGSLFKSAQAKRLTISPGDPGTFWLHSDPAALAAYGREMVAEVWNPEKNLCDNPHGRPNHAWDCEYMLQALAWTLNISTDASGLTNPARGQTDSAAVGSGATLRMRRALYGCSTANAHTRCKPFHRRATWLAPQEIGMEYQSLNKGKKLNLRQACVILACSRSHFYNLVNAGKIPAIGTGEIKGIRVLEADCLEYLNGQTNSK